MSTCINDDIGQKDIRDLLALFGDTLASYLARGEVVHVDKLGTFYCNKKGWIRFLPSRRMKERTTAIKARNLRLRR